MALPKITGTDSQLHTVVPVVFPTLTVEVKVVYIAGPDLDRIDEAGRQTNLQRLIDARASAIGQLIADGATSADADAQVDQVEAVPLLRDDIAVDMIAAGIAGFRTVEPAGDADGLGDTPTPAAWEPFGPVDAAEVWETWPTWAKDQIYLAVRGFSQVGATDPKALAARR